MLIYILFYSFALGPLELRVEKTIGADMKKAKATTETMLGLIDLRIDRRKGTASITNVYFDEPGDVNVSGNLRRRAHLKHNTNGYSPYRYDVCLLPNTLKHGR